MASSLVRSHVHPHAHRRLWLKGSSSWFLLSLSEACADLCLLRLERLVEEVLYERLKDEPPVPLHPDLAGIELPY